jgi:hypothetical protein
MLPRGSESASDNANHSNAVGLLVPDVKPTEIAAADGSLFPSAAPERRVSS